MSNEKKTLPSIQDLYSDVPMKKEQNDLNILLNQEPHASWIKQHPMAKNVRYIPIERIEWLLTRIFIKWRVEVKDKGVIANSVVVTVRLHYLDVLSNDWDWQDGIGAAPIQTASGAGATDFSQVKTDAVMKAAPAAESYAVKDAAEKIGKIFGKDLNRADKVAYDNLINTFKEHDFLSTAQANLIDGLLHTSTLSEEEREQIEREMNGYTAQEAMRCIENLQTRQLDPIKETGNYSAKDLINYKIKDNE